MDFAGDIALRFAALEVDRDGVIIGWSAAAEDMFGQALSEMADRKLATLLEGADAAQLIQALPQASTHATLTRDIFCRRKNGDTFPASLLMSTVDRADGGAPRLTVLVINDERERHRDQLLAAVMHDLGQPITVIETAAYVLERGEDRSTAQRLLGRIKSAAGHLRELSAELLDFGSARCGAQIPLEREHTNLIEVIDEVCSNLRVTHAQGRISITSPDVIAGHWDRKRLRRLAQNLIENALTHSPSQSLIRISCQRRDGDVVLMVENDCAQMPVAILEDLFEPFHRASNRGRAGLGLYIARALARAHGGDVTPSWRSDGVITFTVTLPISVPGQREAVGPDELTTALFSAQRRHRRSPFDTELEIGIRDRVFCARGRDVSLGGLAFWSEAELRVDEMIEIGVSRGPTSFRVLGTVRHVNRHASRSLVGIEFPCDLSEAEINLLKKPLRS
jgi:PAS domain S-box-containing protein